MANPTTNYGFVLPTATDLVTDLPADFDVALQGVDTRLKALQPGTTLGDLAYSSATANTNTRLGVGTSGQVLAVSGGGVPAWTTMGGGKTMSLIASGTLTSGTSITWSSLSTYDTIQVLIDAVNIPTASLLSWRINSNTSSNYRFNGTYWIETNTYPRPYTSTGTNIPTRVTKTTSTTNNYVIEFTNCAQAGFTNFIGQSVYVDNTGNNNMELFQGSYDVAEAVSSINFIVNSGYAFTAGNYRIYGG